jgi:hypothetical protein
MSIGALAAPACHEKLRLSDAWKLITTNRGSLFSGGKITRCVRNRQSEMPIRTLGWNRTTQAGDTAVHGHEYQCLIGVFLNGLAVITLICGLFTSALCKSTGILQKHWDIAKAVGYCKSSGIS